MRPVRDVVEVEHEGQLVERSGRRPGRIGHEGFEGQTCQPGVGDQDESGHALPGAVEDGSQQGVVEPHAKLGDRRRSVPRAHL